ncbi:hypothetical protein [Streptomyces sp. NPDC048489]|uniref:hypothetical protein n=1 Tax=Streptomyces sp. NPDC048489 TaxID=3154504 RepID=UPI003444E933
MQSSTVRTGQAVDAVAQVVPAGQTGQRIPAGGLQLVAYADVVREQRGQCERHRGSDEQCAGPLT